MLNFKVDFLGFYPTPTPKYALKMLLCAPAIF